VTIFGRIVSGADVETWCADTVRKWMSTYLAEKERQDGMAAGALQRPRAIVTVPSFEKWPEDQLPAIMLISVGLADSPEMHGDGVYTARWDMALACVCSARTEAESHAMAQRYMAALRALFLQRPSLGGNADGTTWLGESYDSLPYEDTRSLAAGMAQFVVQVEDVSSARAGPLTPDEPLDPDTDPWAEWPLVQESDVEVDVVDDVTNPIGG
jgi:hypothetical protein